MKRNSKLSLALHALGHMAAEPDRRRTSAEIAEHNATHPVVVRRVLGRLREAGLLASEKGHAGGWHLARPADRITLADVYLALGEPFLPAPEAVPSSCVVEVRLREDIAAALREAEALLIERLRGGTVADLAGAMLLTKLSPD